MVPRRRGVQQRQALDARIDALRATQQAQAQGLQQAEATNRVLRDELLGIGQRAALLEDSVSKLADPDRHGAQSLRLDEIELLLGIGQQRLQLADDLDGARRALALAAPLLAGIDDPAYLNLRQALAQALAINGTPAFIIDTHLTPGYLPAGDLMAAIEEVRGRGCKLC